MIVTAAREILTSLQGCITYGKDSAVWFSSTNQSDKGLAVNTRIVVATGREMGIQNISTQF